jgi:hypothetical protein
MIVKKFVHEKKHPHVMFIMFTFSSSGNVKGPMIAIAAIHVAMPMRSQQTVPML